MSNTPAPSTSVRLPLAPAAPMSLEAALALADHDELTNGEAANPALAVLAAEVRRLQRETDALRELVMSQAREKPPTPPSSGMLFPQATLDTDGRTHKLRV